MYQTNSNYSRCLLVVALLASGCAMDQDDIRKYAIKRPKDDDPPKPAATAPSTSPTATVPSTSTPAQTAPAASPGSAVTPAPGITAAAGGPASPPPGGAPATAPGLTSLSDTRAPDPSLSPRDRRAMTIDNLKRIAAALEAYLADNGSYPPFAIHSTGGRPLLSWRVALLPYLGYQALHEQFRLDQPWDSPLNQALLAQIPAVYQSPDRFDTHTNYLAPYGNTTSFQGARGQVPRRWEDGAENIIVLLEVDDPAAVPWTAPMDLNYDSQNPKASLGNLRGDGFFAGFGGGSLLLVPAEAPPEQVRALFSVDGGEAVSAFAVCKAATADGLVSSTGPPLAPVGPTVSPGLATGSQTTSTSLPVTGFAASNPISSASTRSPFAAPAAAPFSGSGATAGSPRLTDLATQAFAAGYETEAVRLSLAAFLVDEPSQAVSYQWVPGLRRPATAVRFGIGLDYTGPQASATQKRMADLARQNEFKPSQLSSIIGDLAQPIFQRLESASPFLPPPCQSPTTNRRPGLAQGPEVTFLGLANYRTILQAALKENVDVVLMFSVDERTTRSGKKSKTVSFSVRDAWTGREIQRESRLNYLQHETNRTDPLYEDPIDKIAAQFQSVLLEELKPGPFPQELRSDVASRRVAALAKLNHPDPLPVLAEMKLYRLLNLVSVQELLDACQSILESKTGTELVAGTMDEKRAAIESWIPDLRMELSEQARRQAARAADNDDD